MRHLTDRFAQAWRQRVGRALQPSHLLFALLVLLWLYENLVLLQAELRFTADSERDLFYVLGLTAHGILPADGVRMAALGLDLGPLYFLLVAPFTAIWPSPQTVHTFNILVCAGGLVGLFAYLRHALGAAPALLFALLYTQSAGHTAFVDTAWHVGATPGVIMGFIATAGWWADSGRKVALGLATALLCVLVQFHALGVVYGPAALLLLILARRHFDRAALVVLGVTAAVALVPLLWYLVAHLGHDAAFAARHEGGFSFRPGAFFTGLSSLVEARYLISPTWSGWLLFLLAAVGLGGTAFRWRRGERPLHRLMLAAQVVIGALVVSLVLPYENVGRYYIPVFIPLFVMAAFGAYDIDELMAARGRVASARALNWAAVCAGLLFVPPAGLPVLATLSNFGARLDTHDHHDYLTLEEQELVLDYLVGERGLSWSRMRGRVHGVFFGTLTGIRYLERVRLDGRAASEADEAHWYVLPEGIPRLPLTGRVLEEKTLQARTRTIRLVRARPALDPGKVTTGSGTPCPWHLPYIWSEAPEDLLKVHGFSLGHGPDIHNCSQDPNELVLRFDVAPEVEDVTVQMSDDAHFRQGGEVPVSYRIEAEGARPLPPPGRPGLSPAVWRGSQTAWYILRLPPHDGTRTVTVTIRSRGALGFLDIF